MCPRPDNHNNNAAAAATPAAANKSSGVSNSSSDISLLITPQSTTQLLNESSAFFKRAQRSGCSKFFSCVGRGVGNLLLLPFRVLFYCACKICAAARFIFCCGRSNTQPAAVVYPNYGPAAGAYPPGGQVHYAKQSLAGSEHKRSSNLSSRGGRAANARACSSLSDSVFCALTCSPNPLLADDSPAHWEPLDESTKAHGNTTLVLLHKDKHADEIAEVIQNFERTGPRGVIKTVHRVQNKSILTNYLRKREEMLESGVQRGKASDIRADLVVFHGTRMTPPSKIHASPSGFDPSLGMSAPNWLWFAAEARYSAQGFAHTVVQDKMPFYGPGSKEPYQRWSSGGTCLSSPQGNVLKQIFQVRITMDCNPPPQPLKPAAPDRFGVVRTNNRQCLVGPVSEHTAARIVCLQRVALSLTFPLRCCCCLCAQNIYTLTDGSQCLPEYLITFS